jgi:histone H3/H4
MLYVIFSKKTNKKRKNMTENETLVVVSKIKKLIREKAGLNTSASAIDVLSKMVEKEVLKAAQRAKEANRKTVLDRDFPEEL